jgi:hypothetical protein
MSAPWYKLPNSVTRLELLDDGHGGFWNVVQMLDGTGRWFLYPDHNRWAVRAISNPLGRDMRDELHEEPQ